MYTEDQMDVVDSHMAAHRDHDQPSRPRGPSRVTGIGVFLVVALLVGVSVIVFTSWKAQRPAVGTTTPASGQWTHMLDGYTISSLVAAPSNPGTLYACVTPFHAAIAPGGSGSVGSGGVSTTGGGASTSGSGGVSAGSSGTGSGAVASNATIMSSTDYGAHWQDIGAKAALQGTCELAVDPTNSQHIYDVDAPASVSNQGSAATVLKQSSDGGQTWSTITPQWDATVKEAKTLWSITSFTIAGGHMFGVQWLTNSVAGQSGAEPANMPIGHLVESIDGGHTWSVLENAFGNAQGVQRYAIDPTNPSIIYALVGTPFTGGMGVPQGKMPGDVYSLKQELYKTTDNGRSWKLVLKGLFYGADVQVASGKPGIVYAGGMPGPMPLASGAGTGTYAQAGVSFGIQVSSDGGASWHNVPSPTKISPTQSWFVDAQGRLFMAASGVTGSNGTGTSLPPAATSVAPPAGAPVQGKAVPAGAGPITHTASGQGFASYASAEVNGIVQIQWYNPSTNTWSTVLQAPLYGSLLAVTSAGTGGTDTIWLAEYTNNEQGLARYTLSAPGK